MKPKTKWIGAIFILAITAASISIPRDVWKISAFAIWALLFKKPDFLSFQKAENRWGLGTFDSNIFKKGTDKDRTAMAADITKRQIGVGLSLSELKQKLGEPDGGYYNDGCWNYRLTHRSDPEGLLKEEAWSVVFCFKYPEGKVHEVFIWRECCNDPPAWIAR